MRRTTPIIERLLNKCTFEPNTGCWLWMGATAHGGYGSIGDSIIKKDLRIHRVTYEHFKGEIPKGLQIDHKCRVRLCCNPQHLEAVTASENSQRGLKGTLLIRSTHCNAGHPMSGINLGLHKGKYRYCRACKTLRNNSKRCFSKNPYVVNAVRRRTELEPALLTPSPLTKINKNEIN